MISIIIPTYNNADKIGSCFDSILHQKYIPRPTEILIEKDPHDLAEVIVVNDGSTDDTNAVIDSFKPRFNEHGIDLTYVSQDNQGAPAARNKGASLARGEYLLFCDADVVMEPVMLTRMLEELESHPEASYAYSSFRWGRKIFRLWPFDEDRLRAMPFIHTTSLIRREHFPGFDVSVKKLQDWDLWLTMLEQGHGGIWIDQVLFSVKTGGTMSEWVPSFVYKLLPFLPIVRKYRLAIDYVKRKHGL